MGMFDSVIVPCPICGSTQEAQSKGGDCVLAVYEMAEAPLDVLADVNRHAPFTCEQCSAVFAVKVRAVACTQIVEPEAEAQ